MRFTDFFQSISPQTFVFGVICFLILLFSKPISSFLIRLFYPLFKSKYLTDSYSFLKQELAKPLRLLLVLGVMGSTLYLFKNELNQLTHLAIYPVLKKIFWLTFIPVLTWFCMGLVRYVAKIFETKAAQTSSKSDDQLVFFLKDIALIFTVLFGILFTIAKVFDINIFTIITGLGIGGLAIALAARDTLENLFSSFTLFVDKPFVQGDTIQVGSITGEVEKVGFRSAILRSPEGASISVPSRLLTTQTVENQTERSFRRGKIVIKISFDNSSKTINKLIKEIKQILEQKAALSPSDSHVRLDAFHDYGMELHILYHAQIVDSDDFKNFKSNLNMEIWSVFEANKINFVKIQTLENTSEEKPLNELDSNTIGATNNFGTSQNIVKQTFEKTNETNPK